MTKWGYILVFGGLVLFGFGIWLGFISGYIPNEPIKSGPGIQPFQKSDWRDLLPVFGAFPLVAGVISFLVGGVMLTVRRPDGSSQID